MTCPQCGMQLPDGSRFCPGCGRDINQADSGQSRQDQQDQWQVYLPEFWQNRQNQENQQNWQEQQQYQQDQAYRQDQQQSQGRAPWESPYEEWQSKRSYGAQGQAQGHYTPPRNHVSDDPYQGYPMKWHKFLAYFSLWIAAVGNGLYGFQYLSGAHWQGYTEAVYRWFPGLKTADFVFGLACLGLSALGFITALKLLRLRRNAPTWLMMVYIGYAAATLLYMILVKAAFGDLAKLVPSSMETFTRKSVMYALGYGVMVVINKIYYDKRIHLFVK